MPGAQRRLTKENTSLYYCNTREGKDALAIVAKSHLPCSLAGPYDKNDMPIPQLRRPYLETPSKTYVGLSEIANFLRQHKDAEEQTYVTDLHFYR